MARSRTIIGIDIGARGVHAVQCVSSSDGPVVSATLSYPRLSRADARIADEARRLTGALLRRGFHGTEMVICLPDDYLLASYLDLPPRSSGAPVELLAAAELGRIYKKEPATMEIAVWELPASGRKGGGATQCLAVACAHEHSDPFVEAFSASDMIVRAIEPRLASLARAGSAFAHPGAAAAFEVMFVLDIGFDRCQLIVLRSGKLIDRRPVDAAEARSLIVELANALHIDAATAQLLLANPSVWQSDQAKHQFGWNDSASATETSPAIPSAGPRGLATEQTRREVVTVIERFAAVLAEELRLSMEYVAHRHGGVECSAIFLAGEYGGLPGMAESLASRTAVAVTPICFGTEDAAVTPPLAAAFGAAVSAWEIQR